MKNLYFLVFVAIILQCPLYSWSQFSRQQAVDLVLNQILVADTGHISLYCSYTTIQDTGKIILGDGETISPTYQDNWVFFSDDHPRANWYHPCRIIFVNSNTGDFQINASLAYPIDIELNYQPLLASYPCPATCQPNGTLIPPDSLHIVPTNTNSHLHALLINGIDRLNGWGSCTCNFDYDIAMIYNALEEIGYTTHYNPPPGPNQSNVIVLYDNGSTIFPFAGKTAFANDWDGYPSHDPPNNLYNEVDGAATIDNINNTFTNLSGELTPEDQLFIYITGIGIPQAFECYHDTGTLPVYMTASQLNNAVRNINCAQIVFVLQQSYSGSFKDILTDITGAKCKNRLVITATDDVSSSYKELWTHCGNIDEFTYYFTAALRGHYEGRWPWEWSYPVGEMPFNDPRFGIPWNADGCSIATHPSDYKPDSGTPPPTINNTIPQGNNDGYTQFIEAFNYTKYMDTWCQDGYLDQRKTMVVENPNPPHNWITFNTNVSCISDIETPQMKATLGFDLSNLMCLNGIAGNSVTSTGTIEVLGGNTVDYQGLLLGGNLNVHTNMQIQNYASITIGVDNANIDVDQNSLFQVGTGFKLNGQSSNTNWLNILNLSNPLNLQHSLFSSINLMNYGSLTIGSTANNPPNPTFNNCYSLASNGDVTIEYSYFNNSSVYLGDDPSSNHTATVDNCTFTTDINHPIDNLALTHLKNYNITSNIFSGGLYGIGLYDDGSISCINLVQGNHISNCTSGGIFIYQSKCILDVNHIHDIYNTWAEGNGVSIMDNNSNVSMTGKQSAQDQTFTQEIVDCDGLDIYATTYCFPYLMRFNVINNDGIPNNSVHMYIMMRSVTIMHQY